MFWQTAPGSAPAAPRCLTSSGSDVTGTRTTGSGLPKKDGTGGVRVRVCAHAPLAVAGEGGASRDEGKTSSRSRRFYLDDCVVIHPPTLSPFPRSHGDIDRQGDGRPRRWSPMHVTKPLPFPCSSCRRGACGVVAGGRQSSSPPPQCNYSPASRFHQLRLRRKTGCPAADPSPASHLLCH